MSWPTTRTGVGSAASEPARRRQPHGCSVTSGRGFHARVGPPCILSACRNLRGDIRPRNRGLLWLIPRIFLQLFAGRGKKSGAVSRTVRLQQTGSGIGSRSKKSGQSTVFIGYKKHTLVFLLTIAGRLVFVPLCSLVEPANVNDRIPLKPLLKRALKSPGWPLLLLIVDKGYIDATCARLLRRWCGIALIADPKSNMKPPDGTDRDGCPLCPAGERLVWEDYDSNTQQLYYRGDIQSCHKCPLAGTCPKQFEFDAGTHETFWGMVPSHSRLARQLLRLCRPSVERTFNTDKNTHALKHFFLNSRELAQTLSTMSDTLEVLKLLTREPVRPPKAKPTGQAEWIQYELWDRLDE